MALETCFQVSTIASSYNRTRLASSHKTQSIHKEKTNLLASYGLKRANSPLSLTSRNRRISPFTCQAETVVAENVVDEVLAVNDNNWEKLVKQSDSTVLVEFYAPECDLCDLSSSLLDGLMKTKQSSIVRYKCNAEESPKVVARYKIEKVPTVVAFIEGKKRAHVIGKRPLKKPQEEESEEEEEE